ncbi:TlpA disulfide reductase family protein [Xanthomarina sp. F1114]|uniref:TlpA disulfide reductase family protein n=1 Tax=Xanthomarina sp. F1114 TaxID=2996019 RepID=UPI00225E067E|nr:TlpA disulfide reductase family protein [Xanthomarina sp. F1114]MCX7547759.1 TlpA disulfide reductase family protein [Xanthomarina sp. F1114]
MVQKITTLFLVAFMFISCKNEAPQTGFIIEANIDKPLDNVKAKLFSIDGEKEVILDSTTVIDSKLTLKGEVSSPDLYYLNIEGIPGFLPIIVENENMSMEIYKDSLQSSVVSGSRENDLLGLYHQDSQILKKKNSEYAQQFRDAQGQGDNDRMNEIQAEFKQLVDEANSRHLELIKERPDLVTSAAILGNILMSEGISKAEAQEIFNSFSDEVTNSKFGKAIDGNLSKVTLEVGNMAPDFSAPSPEGNLVSLYDIKGKVTIIDFWAAWCGPCRKENPNVVKIYEKYKDKGLEIIGVSLDGSPNQKDAKAAWLDAIEKDNLTWPQISNLAFFNDPIAKEYQIQAIPATFIIDSEGKIVAKNLRGAALDNKIAELLN